MWDLSPSSIFKVEKRVPYILRRMSEIKNESFPNKNTTWYEEIVRRTTKLKFQAIHIYSRRNLLVKCPLHVSISSAPTCLQSFRQDTHYVRFREPYVPQCVYTFITVSTFHYSNYIAVPIPVRMYHNNYGKKNKATLHLKKMNTIENVPIPTEKITLSRYTRPTKY